MEAGSREVHAFTQLRISEQALRGKRARPSKEGQFVKAYQLKSEEYITPVVRTDGRSMHRWKAGRATEKLANWDHQIQMMMAPLARQPPSSTRATIRRDACRSTGTLQSAKSTRTSQTPSHSHTGQSTEAKECHCSTRLLARGEHTRSRSNFSSSTGWSSNWWKNHGGGPVSRLYFMQINSLFGFLSARFSDACILRPSEWKVQHTPQSPHHLTFLHQSSSVTPYCFVLASLRICLVCEVFCREFTC